MAPFNHKFCPVCLTETTQYWLTNDPAELGPVERMRAICESCLTVLIYRGDGSVSRRAATDAERDVVPPKIDTNTEPWVTMRAELRQGRVELRTWVRAGCSGLTPELEAAILPGFRERLRRFVELSDDATGPEKHAEPRPCT